MKYILLILVVLVLWWVWKKRSDRPEERAPSADRQPEKIVECAHCGVLHPLGESLPEGDFNYCCSAHRQAGRRPKQP